MPSGVAFNLFGQEVRWYGIVIMFGVLVACLISYAEAKRRGQDPERVWQLLPWVLVLGILGARLGWVVSEASTHQFNSLWEVLIGSGSGGIGIRGLSIQGALVGGVLAVALFCWRYKLYFFQWADIIVPGLALAQAIGRWGNFFNQEAFGRPTDLPWGIPISVQQQQAVAGPNAGFTPSPDLRFHPTFAYEMILNVLNFGLLMWLGRQRRFKLYQGDLLWIYLIVYSISRYFVEAIRVDSATISGFKTPQIVALGTIVLALAIMIYRHRPGTTAHVATVGVAPAVDANLTSNIADDEEVVAVPTAPASPVALTSGDAAKASRRSKT